MLAAWASAAVLAASAAAAPAPSEAVPSWRQTLTPHFAIKHETAWLPSGLTMGVEKAHFRLGMDLGMFSNWSAKERINLYLYKDMRSYAQGEFQPPPWSNGVAIYDRNAVAIPAMRETSQMIRVLSHEATHLIFVNYFRQSRRDPPHWVNEGLAMLEEAASPEKPETSRWYQTMVETDPGSWFEMSRFFDLSPTKDLGDDKAKVSLFYVQAYSVTHFLVRKHSRLQFKAFCSDLRDGKSAAESLRLVYHYRDPGAFEKRWRKWLADPAHKRRVAALAASERGGDDGVIDQAVKGASFRGFSSGWEIKTKTVFPAASSDQPPIDKR